MGYAKHVGRVGALAFALGLGTVVATTTPGVAFADETDPDTNVGTNQPNDPGPATGTPNENPDPTPPTRGETTPPGENNQHQRNDTNTQSPSDGTEIRTAERGEVLNTGGYRPDENNSEEKTPEPTGTTRPVVHVPETAPVITPKDWLRSHGTVIDEGKSKYVQQQQQRKAALQITPGPDLEKTKGLESTGAQQRDTSLSGSARGLPKDNAMATFSAADDDSQTAQTTASAAAPAPTPTLTSVFTGFLALVGLGPSTGAGTPSLPFVPAPIFDAIFAFVRRIESTLSNQTPTATVDSRQNGQGELAGQIVGDDEDGDNLTYAVGTGPEHGNLILDPDTGEFTYTPDPAPAGGPAWRQDEFTVLVSDNTSPHIHLFSDTGHTYEVTVKVPGPQPIPPPPPPGSTTITGQITGVTNPSGGPVEYVVQTPPGSGEHLEVDEDGTYTFTPSTPLAHGAAVDEDGDGQPDNPVFQKFTVVATDQDGNETTIELSLPVTPSNTAPEPNPTAETPPQPTPTGGFTGQIPVLPDADGDEVKIIRAVASDGTPVTFDGLNWTYGATTTARSAAPQGFAPQMARMSLAGPDEGFSDDAQFSTMAAADPVTITFTLSDGHGGVVPYTVALPAVDEAPVDVSAPGGPQGPAIVDASRDRAYQVSYVKSATDDPSRGRYSGTTYVTVIDTRTGESVGDSVAMPGKINSGTAPAAFSGDTSHVFFTTEYYDPATATASTYVAAIDAESGDLIDNDQGAATDNKLLRLSKNTNSYSAGRLLVRGDRIYVTTDGTDPQSGTRLTNLAILDANSGELLATPLAVAGDNMSGDDIVFGGNDRAYLIRHDWTADPTADQTYVAVVDTATGQLVGSEPIDTNGQPTGNLVVDDSTGRAYLTTIRSTSSGGKTWITVIDTENGRAVDTPVERDGIGIHSVVLSKNGDRAYQLLQTGSFTSLADSSQTIVVVNTATGAADGADIEVNVPGGAGGDLVLDHNANGNEHAYVSTITPDYQHTTITAIDLQIRTVVGQIADIDGIPPRAPVVSGSGKTVYQVVDGTDGSGALVTRVALFDTATGAAIGQPIEVAGGQANEVQEIGNRLYVQTEQFDVRDPDNSTDDTYVSRVAVINTQTGQLMGAPLQTDGSTAGDITVNGDRAYQRTVDEDRQITRITVIDATTGQRVGAGPIALDGTIPDDFAASPFNPPGDAPLVFGGDDRVYQVTEFDNNDGTYTVRVAVIDTESGALLNAEPVDIERTVSTKVLQVADDGRVYLTVFSVDDATNPFTDRFVTLAVLDADSGALIGDPLTKDGIGFLVNDSAGQPRYLLSLTQDFSTGFGGAKDVTFTPLTGGDSLTVPGSAVAYATSPDGSLAYVVTDGTEDSTITVIDLERGEIVATSSTVPGHAGVAITPPYTVEGQGGLVFGADGKGYLTTYIKNADGTYTTQVTGLPGLTPTSSMMSFRALNVLYPEPDDSNPLLPEQFSSNTGDPAQFDMNSLLAV